MVTSGSVVVRTPGTYQLVYSAQDRAGNPATSLTRTVTVVDTQAPTVTLIGDASMKLEGGNAFVDPRASATDSLDGDLSSKLVISYVKVPAVAAASLPVVDGVPSIQALTSNQMAGYATTAVDTYAPAGTVFGIVYTATDVAGNHASVTRSVLVKDTVSTFIYLRAPATAQLEGQSQPVPFVSPVAAPTFLVSHMMISGR